MINTTKNFFRSKGVRDALLVSAGKVISAGLGFLASIIIARKLGPENFGLFTLSIVIMMLAAEFTGGSLTQALVKFSSSYFQSDRKKVDLTFKVVFKMTAIVSLILIPLGFLLSKPLSIFVFHNVEMERLIKIAIIGSVGIIFFRYTLAILQTYQLFAKYIVLDLGNNIMKLAAIGLLAMGAVITTTNSAAVYMTVPFLSFLMGIMVISKDFFYAKGPQKKVANELIHFSKWMMISTALFTVYSRMDILFLSYMKDSHLVGVYSAAFLVTSSLELVAIALFTVIFPKVSRFSERAEYVNFVRKYLIIVLPLSCFACIFLFLVSKPLILTFYAAEYKESIPILKLLAPASAIYSIAIPLSSLLLAMNKPQIIVRIEVFIVAFMFIACFLLIPSYGAIGSALALLLSKLVLTTLIVIRTIQEIRKLPVKINYT